MLWLGHPVVRWCAVAMLSGGMMCAVAALRTPRRDPELGDPYLGGPEVEAGHVVMLAAMLLMVGAPTLDLQSWWRGLFTMVAAFYAVRLWHHARDATSGRTGATVRAGAAGYHLVAALAMLCATVGQDHHGHAHGAAARPTGSDMPWPWLAWLLTGLFLAGALFAAVVFVTGRVPGSDERAHGPIRTALVAHLVMDLAMVPMLWSTAARRG
ncbi:MAG: DUF5134 domain-containing protein [Microthrixaceae bacterium]